MTIQHLFITIRGMYRNKKLKIRVSMDDATAKMVNGGHFTLANLRESRH